MTSLANTTTTAEIGKSPESVVEFLENAKWMLDAAVEMTGPAEVALLKAQVVMADTYARELALSKDIQEQSREMVRRAEYALARAIRKGQEDGTVYAPGKNPFAGNQHGEVAPVDSSSIPVTSLASTSELYNSKGGILELASVSVDDFDQAIEDAKAEGNLSRANVVRKVKGQNESAPLTRQQRADLIVDLADQGLSSRQMPAKVGVTEETVRQIARDFEIDIPADKIVGRSRRLDHTQMVDSTVTDLENTAEFIESHIDLAEVDLTEVDEWVSSLSRSIAALNRFRNQLKEKTHA